LSGAVTVDDVATFGFPEIVIAPKSVVGVELGWTLGEAVPP
jgi:hypothetical protein